MHSVSSNAVAQSLSYSTTEQRTGGKWIDGKPIYRIVYTGTANSTTGSNLIANPISNLDAVIELYGMVYWKNDWGIIGGSGLSIPSVITLQYTTANDRQQGLFLSYPSSGYTSFHYYRIILEYTKTTD